MISRHATEGHTTTDRATREALTRQVDANALLRGIG